MIILIASQGIENAISAFVEDVDLITQSACLFDGQSQLISLDSED